MRICVLLKPPSASLCARPLLLGSERYCSIKKHRYAVGAEQLHVEITPLRSEASIAKRNGD